MRSGVLSVAEVGLYLDDATSQDIPTGEPVCEERPNQLWGDLLSGAGEECASEFGAGLHERGRITAVPASIP